MPAFVFLDRRRHKIIPAIIATMRTKIPTAMPMNTSKRRSPITGCERVLMPAPVSNWLGLLEPGGGGMVFLGGWVPWAEKAAANKASNLGVPSPVTFYEYQWFIGAQWNKWRTGSHPDAVLNPVVPQPAIYFLVINLQVVIRTNDCFLGWYP